MRILIFIVFWAFPSSGFSQEIKPLSVGDTLPAQYLSLVQQKNQPKLTILDFWASWCGPCMAAIPKMGALQKQFGSDLNIVLVNDEEPETAIKSTIDRINAGKDKANKFKLPELLQVNGYKDKIFSSLFPHNDLPHEVWLDESGRVVAITGAYNVTSEHIKAIIEKRPIEMAIQRKINHFKSFGIMRSLEDNEKQALNYSLFSRSTGDARRFISLKGDSSTKFYRITFFNLSPAQLFEEAFRTDYSFGRILFELKDKRFIDKPEDTNLWDSWSKDFCFNYEIQSLGVKIGELYKRCQQDLNYFLGNLFNITAAKEIRKLKCIVVHKPKDVLKSKNQNKGVDYRENVNDVHIYKNFPFKQFVFSLFVQFDNVLAGMTVVDDSRYEGNIDIKLTGDLNNLQNIKSQLIANGINVTQEDRNVEVVVVKQKSTQN